MSTKSDILMAGAKLASKHGAKNVTRRMVAKEAGVSEGIVSHHFGTAAEAQAKYAAKAKREGFKMPTAEQTKAIGIKLRAHGPRKPAPPRKRSQKELDAIAKKRATKKAPVKKAGKATGARTAAKPASSGGLGKGVYTGTNPRIAAAHKRAGGVHQPRKMPTAKMPGPTETKPDVSMPVAPNRGPQHAPLSGPTEHKTAARMPKAPPSNVAE